MKKGFSLIELVFAIVIIGISVSVLPRIVYQSQTSNEFAIKQELTFHAKSMMIRIMQGAWDSRHVLRRCEVRKKDAGCTVGSSDFNSTSVDPIPIYNIGIAGRGANERVGIIPEGEGVQTSNLGDFSEGAFVSTNEDSFTTISYGPDLKNDIDDWNGVSFIITSRADSGDFLYDVNISIAVEYINDNWVVGDHRNDRNITKNLNTINGNPTNIKRVIVTAKNNNDNAQNVKLYAYFSNIGQAFFNELEWKNVP